MSTAPFIAGRRRPHASSLLLATLLVAAGWEGALQLEEDVVVRETALRVVGEAHAVTRYEQVVALRDWIRAHVSCRDAATCESEPFLRPTTMETLRSRVGGCRDSSRVFINLTRSIGIDAQRLHLYGRETLVVAEVELVPHQHLIVDTQPHPTIAELELMDTLMMRREFHGYSTVDLRELHLGSAIARIRMELGPYTYWLENPHALKAGASAALALCLLAASAARGMLRTVLRRRGWVHRSELGP